MNSLAKHFIEDALLTFRGYKKLAEKAIEQTSDEEFFLSLDEEANSIAVIIKHISGNMLSRWTDFLTTDGEKPDRNRDLEFVVTAETSRDDLLAQWERGWSCLFGALEGLQPEDAERKVLIRGAEHTVVEAINRQLTHYAYHVGQIVFLAKHFKSAEWKSLSIPRNKSADFNAYLTEKTQAGVGQTRSSRFDEPQNFIRESEKDELQNPEVRSQNSE
ncbi:MAG: hypothetical protein QOJ02_3253 [Acidobacteriota bacterium]|jgi:hypothetical protein|nr:hypothetical protein [Acidobacteriota bacterium]